MNKHMITRARRQAGSGIIVLALFILVAAGIGVVGYKVYQSSKSPATDSASTTGQSTAQKPEIQADDAPQITSASDLDKASSTLNQLDAESDASDTTQLSGQLKDL